MIRRTKSTVPAHEQIVRPAPTPRKPIVRMGDSVDGKTMRWAALCPVCGYQFMLCFTAPDTQRIACFGPKGCNTRIIATFDGKADPTLTVEGKA